MYMLLTSPFLVAKLSLILLILDHQKNIVPSDFSFSVFIHCLAPILLIAFFLDDENKFGNIVAILCDRC